MKANDISTNKVCIMNNYLLKKGILDLRKNTNNQRIRELVERLDINISRKNDDSFTLKFDSTEQINRILCKLALSDLLKIKYHNKENKILDEFFDSLSSV